MNEGSRTDLKEILIAAVENSGYTVIDSIHVGEFATLLRPGALWLITIEGAEVRKQEALSK